MDNDSTIVDSVGDSSTEVPDGRDRIQLLVMAPNAFTTYPLSTPGVVIVGRGSTATVRIDDPLASREHLRIHVAESIVVEDLRSVNGTRVRERVLAPDERVVVVPGEAIVVGGTVLIVQKGQNALGPRRLLSHDAFEGRVEAECDQGREGGRPLVLARFQLQKPLSWSLLAPILAQEVAPPHLFAAYAPHDYELLFVDMTKVAARPLIDRIGERLQALGVPTRTAMVAFPEEGRTAHELLASVNEPLRVVPRPFHPPGPVEPDQAPEMAKVYGLAARAATSNLNILIFGETGVGKEVLSRFIHTTSPRTNRPLLTLNCGAFPESLVESEFFGFERGAFSGATQAKPGLLESAHLGTVLLDEIGDLPLAVQVKLLRAIESREVTRLGAIRPIHIDVRFIAATNRDLDRDMDQGTFRRDLFYRLDGINLTIPPLRRRVSEIMPLARTFAATECAAMSRPVPCFSAEAIDILEGYGWKGNIRELKNVVERALVLCAGDEILPHHLPLERMLPRDFSERGASSSEAEGRSEVRSDVRPDVRSDARSAGAAIDSEKDRVINALASNAGNQTRAAAALGISRRAFVKKLDRYAVPRPQKRTPVPG